MIADPPERHIDRVVSDQPPGLTDITLSWMRICFGSVESAWFSTESAFRWLRDIKQLAVQIPFAPSAACCCPSLTDTDVLSAHAGPLRC